MNTRQDSGEELGLRLYLVRHGIAVERDRCTSDAARPLTRAGQHKTQQVAQRLSALGVRWDAIASSPLVRAQQTAEILCQADLSPGFTTLDCLAPGGSLLDGLTWLLNLQQQMATTSAPNPKTAIAAKAVAAKPSSSAPTGQIALVGHEPDLSAWAEQLIWGQVLGQLQLKKAGVIGLQLPPSSALQAQPSAAIGHSILFWLTPPRLLLA